MTYFSTTFYRIKRTSLSGRNHGAAMVEMAFALPLFILLVAGILDFGRLFYQQMVINDGIRLAGHIGAISRASDCDTRGAAAEAAFASYVQRFGFWMHLNNLSYIVTYPDYGAEFEFGVNANLTCVLCQIILRKMGPVNYGTSSHFHFEHGACS